jgi:hypothetical protein
MMRRLKYVLALFMVLGLAGAGTAVMTSNSDLFIASAAAMTDSATYAGGAAALPCCGFGASCTLIAGTSHGCGGSVLLFATALPPVPAATGGAWLPGGDAAAAVPEADTPLRPPQA